MFAWEHVKVSNSGNIWKTMFWWMFGAAAGIFKITLKFWKRSLVKLPWQRKIADTKLIWFYDPGASVVKVANCVSKYTYTGCSKEDW